VAAEPSPRSLDGGWWDWLGRYGLLTIALVLLTGCLILSFHKIREQHRAELAEAGMSLWLTTQADLELQRLRHALDAYALGHREVDQGAMLERFEIFWSRLPLLVEGRDSETIREATGAEILVPSILERLRAMEPELQALRPGDEALHAKLAGSLDAFVLPLHEIVVRVGNSLGQAGDNRQARRYALYLQQSAYLIGILVSGAILIALLLRETTRTRELLAEANEAQHQAWHLAHHDPVTQLPNRWLFEDRLEHTLRGALRDGQPIALHYLDLDHFKSINDSFGHVVGDRLLVAVARRLDSVLRQSDTLARLGGDEFAVIQTGLPDASAARLLGERLVNSLRSPLEVDGHVLNASVSIGIGLYPDHASNAAELHRAADQALYDAKAAGRDGCIMYDPSEGRHPARRQALAV
jgi:diguanylate cyclase (GGDEF)-like protein